VRTPPDDPLERLREAGRAAASLGLSAEAAAADEVAERIAARRGFPGDVYVVALAGGTGVGKSSLLNALAGRTVSEVRAVRPTTDQPLAYVARDRAAELQPLLAWLGAREVVTHDDRALAGVAILDLPDVDSVRTAHRARVDELLPRIDAITWVVDPEKYDDERLHAYWRTLTRHADRLRFVLNKADRLQPAAQARVRADLAERLLADGIPDARVLVVSALSGEGIERFRDQLASAADAKALVAAKLEADRRQAAERLATSVGLAPGGYAPLVDDQRRSAAVREAVGGALALIDPPGVGRQIRAAVLNRARVRGGSLLARVAALLGWLTGSRRTRADPGVYLQAWRRRGALGRVMNPIRALLLEASSGVAPSARPAILETLGADDSEEVIGRALDDVARRQAGSLEIRASALWPVIGLLQLVVGAVFLFAVAWYVTLFVSGGRVPVATLDTPWLGPIPMPLVLLVGAVVLSALLGWILSLHARFVGRRIARRVEAETAAAVEAAISDVALGGLLRVEEARRTIAAAVAPRDIGATVRK
jgi:GTP-binding protein EngB required for normal cell division